MEMVVQSIFSNHPINFISSSSGLKSYYRLAYHKRNHDHHRPVNSQVSMTNSVLDLAGVDGVVHEVQQFHRSSREHGMHARVTMVGDSFLTMTMMTSWDDRIQVLVRDIQVRDYEVLHRMRM